MRYRKLTAAGDYVFGNNGGDYLRNTPETVAQAVVSRLRLLQGEWFMDDSAGTAWATRILGTNTAGTRDLEILSVVTGTEGVLKVSSFNSRLNGETRQYSVNMVLDTIYGEATIDALVT